MEAYEQLRRAARNKRDAAIRKARSDYQQELRAIGALKNSLEGVTPCRGAPSQGVGPKRRTVADMVRSILPPTGTFTISDIAASLRSLDATRRYRRDSLRVLIGKLRDEGLIRRSHRVGKGQVIWEVLPQPEKPPVPFEVLRLPEAVGVILGERGPLRVPDIVVALQDRGYRVDAVPRRLQESVRATLRRCRERFACDGDRRWSGL